ncbi:MAG: hypothetical protein SNJ54_17080 [Anaerolineae bacterium]
MNVKIFRRLLANYLDRRAYHAWTREAEVLHDRVFLKLVAANDGDMHRAAAEYERMTADAEFARHQAHVLWTELGLLEAMSDQELLKWIAAESDA